MSNNLFVHMATINFEASRRSTIASADIPGSANNAFLQSHEYGMSYLQECLFRMGEAIRRDFHTICTMSCVSFGPDGGGKIAAAVQGECVEAIRSAFPDIDVRALTEYEYGVYSRDDQREAA